MLHANLEILNLRALPTAHLPLDRILYILSNNPLLRSLTLHFQGVLSAVLPLSNVTLPRLTKLDIGGHYLLTQIIDSLTLPSLTDFTVDIEARDSIEENIIGLVMRSHYPHVEHLSIAYGSSSSASTYYFGPGGVMISWNTLFAEMTHLKSWHIGGTPLEPLLTALGMGLSRVESPRDEELQCAQRVGGEARPDGGGQESPQWFKFVFGFLVVIVNGWDGGGGWWFGCRWSFFSFGGRYDAGEAQDARDA